MSKVDNNPKHVTEQLPVLPLRDVVVYPYMVIPLFVGRPKSIVALETAMKANKQILLVAQRSAVQDEPTEGDLYDVGTIASVLQLLKLPDGTVKVLVEGTERVRILKFYSTEEYFSAEIEYFAKAISESADIKVLARSVINQFEKYIKLNNKIPTEILPTLLSIDDLGRLADTIAAHVSMPIEEKQNLLAQSCPIQRIEKLIMVMDTEIDLLNLEKKIRTRVKGQMEKSQREYYLNEQLKAIHKELGDEDGNEHDDLSKRIHSSGMPKPAQDKALAELKKLKLMSPMSAEATVVRNYLDTMLNVPWQKKSRLKHDLAMAEEILDEDHYGLETIKERIVEHLAVQARVKKIRGPVLCLVGPPGVGKTSLGQSIARATGRTLIRMSLGGVRDEAEIRGHRRTYIGALPGKIIQKLIKAEVKNPLFLLDEVDKMGMDHRGDPASALLEVLDPEQNNTFNDHYLEVDYDLSDVMFIATSNSLDIPLPLLDRMEIIRIPGYTEVEKLNIAKRHLVPKQLEAAGLKAKEVEITEATLVAIIRYYTREAGVRNLEREISKVYRKVVRELMLAKKQKASAKAKKIVITPKQLEKYLGVEKHRHGLAETEDRIGHVAGLAWTEVGGELLQIEVAAVPGRGNSTYTGSLGDVMQESIKTALTVVRTRARSLGIKRDHFEKTDIHVHVPAGATPKDGPSAGIGMCTGLVSVVTGIPVRCDVAMTGEITLRGEVLAIGGLKEKLLAAHRGGIKTVIIPEENRQDLKEIPELIKKDLSIKLVRWIDEVLTIALCSQPTPLTEEEFACETTTVGGAALPKGKKSRKDSDSKRAH